MLLEHSNEVVETDEDLREYIITAEISQSSVLGFLLCYVYQSTHFADNLDEDVTVKYPENVEFYTTETVYVMMFSKGFLWTRAAHKLTVVKTNQFDLRPTLGKAVFLVSDLIPINMLRLAPRQIIRRCTQYTEM